MGDLQPGKGFMGDATEESIDFFFNAFDELRSVFQNLNANELIDNGKPSELLKAMRDQHGWQTEKDGFGQKVFKLLEWGNGAYRVTLALTSRGMLKVDVRSWFVPGA